MKKMAFVLGLALALTVATERRASAHGGFKICFGVSWSKWNPCCDNGCGGAGFPAVDPALFGLGGYGYGGYGCAYPGCAAPYAYGAPQFAAPAAAQPVQFFPQLGNPSGYQPVGYSYPMPGYYQAPSYWYGY